MNASGTTPTLRLAHAEDEPIIFYGPPDRLQGAIRLHNASTEKLKLSSVTFDAPDIQGPGRMPLRQLQLAARLSPDEQAKVSATIQLDPTTPPGKYEAVMMLGERRQRVQVYVTENIDLRGEPTRVSIYTEGELVFEREVVVENAGNVPLRFGGLCIVPLVDAMELRAAIRSGLADACDLEPEAVLKAFFCAWSEQQVGTVSIAREDITLQPGETRPLTLTFTLPDNLHRFRRYEADLPIYNASLFLEVTTGDLPKRQRPEKRSKS